MLTRVNNFRSGNDRGDTINSQLGINIHRELPSEEFTLCIHCVDFSAAYDVNTFDYHAREMQFEYGVNAV